MSSLKQFLVNQDKQETKIHWTMGRSEVRRQLTLSTTLRVQPETFLLDDQYKQVPSGRNPLQYF